MVTILKQIQSYLPNTPEGEFDNQIVAGDQLSLERAVNVISSVSNGYTPEDRLEGMNMQLGDWHAGMKLLSVSIFHIGEKTTAYSMQISTATNIEWHTYIQ